MSPTWLGIIGGADSGSSYQHLAFLHESAALLTTFFWLTSCGNLLQKLRKERSASGLSFQSLFALSISQILSFLILSLIFFGHFTVESPISICFFCCQGLTCALVGSAFFIAFRNFVHSYEDSLDTFGSIIFFFCRSNKGGCVSSFSIETAADSAIAGGVPTTTTTTATTTATATATAASLHSTAASSAKASPGYNGGATPASLTTTAKSRDCFVGSTMSSRKKHLLKLMTRPQFSLLCNFVNKDKLAVSLSVFQWHWVSLYLLAALVAIPAELLRSHRVLPPMLSYLESFADVITAVALLPQLQMFHASNRTVTPAMGRFVVAMLCARVSSFLYWSTDFWFHTNSVLPGRGVKIVTELLNIVILSDFGFFFAKSRLKGFQHTMLPL